MYVFSLSLLFVSFLCPSLQHIDSSLHSFADYSLHFIVIMRPLVQQGTRSSSNNAAFTLAERFVTKSLTNIRNCDGEMTHICCTPWQRNALLITLQSECIHLIVLLWTTHRLTFTVRSSFHTLANTCLKSTQRPIPFFSSENQRILFGTGK